MLVEIKFDLSDSLSHSECTEFSRELFNTDQYESPVLFDWPYPELPMTGDLIRGSVFGDRTLNLLVSNFYFTVDGRTWHKQQPAVLVQLALRLFYVDVT